MTFGLAEFFLATSIVSWIGNAIRRNTKKQAIVRPYRIDWRFTPAMVIDDVRRADTADRLGFNARAARAEHPLGTYFDKHNKPVGNVMTGAHAPPEQGVPPLHVTFVENVNMEKDTPAPTIGGFRAVRFKNDEPSTIEEFGGQEHVTQALAIKVKAMRPDQVSLDPILFLGPPGLGKTTLAKILTNELRIKNMEKGIIESDFIQVMGAQLDTEAALDAVIKRAAASRGSVIFIDEVHELKGPFITKLYPLLTDEREYLFNGDRDPSHLPDITFITATTDAGQLHPALRRRFEQFSFLPLPSAELQKIVVARDPEIELDAANLIVSRTHWGGAPWEPLQVRSMAEEVARSHSRTTITVADVNEVIAIHGYDALGLTHLDRRVLTAIYSRKRFRNGKPGKPQEFVCYGDSEEVITRLAGVDKALYREQIKPRLMARSLVYTRAGYGQTLTDEGIKHAESRAA
jgi:Holliday junction DNA helicase RuvB